MKIKWHGEQFNKRLSQRLGRGLDKAGEYLVQEIKKEIGTQGPPRSRPGNPPHIDTRQLIDSYAYSVDTSKLVMTTGSNVPWSVYLETGTRKMAVRPYLTNTFIVSGNEMARLVLTTS